jgi:hypothetical protein
MAENDGNSDASSKRRKAAQYNENVTARETARRLPVAFPDPRSTPTPPGVVTQAEKRQMLHAFAKSRLERLVDQHLRRQLGIPEPESLPLDGPIAEPLQFLATCKWLVDPDYREIVDETNPALNAEVDAEFDRVDELIERAGIAPRAADALGEPTKEMWFITADRLGDAMKQERAVSLDVYEELYNATGNGLYAWAALLYAGQYGPSDGSLPQWLHTYLLVACTQLLCVIPTAKRSQRPRLVTQALGLASPRRARRGPDKDSFDELNDYTRRQMADDVLWHHEDDQPAQSLTKDGAFGTVAEEWGCHWKTAERAWRDHQEVARVSKTKRAARRAFWVDYYKQRGLSGTSRHAPAERAHPCPVHRWGRETWAEMRASVRAARGAHAPGEPIAEVVNPRSRVNPRTRRSDRKKRNVTQRRQP